MNCSIVNILKAACISAAFFFCESSLALPNSYDNVKNKAAELLAQKKKSQALQLIINFSKTDRSKPFKNETSDLLFLAAQSFLSKEAQEEYESSLNFTLENEKSSLKAAERCLALEPQNLDCVIQKARLAYRSRNEKLFKNTILQIKELLANSNYENLYGLYLERNDPEFKNKQILPALNDSLPERLFGFVLLELERCFTAKNFSRAKDVLLYLEKNYPDWPDLVFYKNKLNVESEEDPAKISTELMAAYASKCKSITKSMARKFRYDFDLCNRGGKS